MIRLALLPLAMLAATPAFAQDESDELPCTAANAERVTLEQLNTDFREWAGRCIMVRGLHAYGTYATNNRLWSSREATLEGLDPDATSLTINYGAELEHEAHPPRWEEVTGRFGSCVLQYEWAERERVANPGSFIMLGGLCHYTLDAHFVFPTAYTSVDGPEVTRLTRAEVPEEFRQFEPVDLTDEGMTPYREAFEEMLQYIEHGELRDFVRLTDSYAFAEYGDSPWHEFETEDFEKLAEWHGWLDDVGEVWRDFRRNRSDRIYALGYWEDHYGEDNELEEPVRRLADWNADEAATLCLLREGYGPEVLPVTAPDIDNQQSRPYFCAYIDLSNAEPAVTVPFHDTGFPEPPRDFHATQGE